MGEFSKSKDVLMEYREEIPSLMKAFRVVHNTPSLSLQHAHNTWKHCPSGFVHGVLPVPRPPWTQSVRHSTISTQDASLARFGIFDHCSSRAVCVLGLLLAGEQA
eukprot:6481007-Amphidinium_carterae.1